MTDRDALLRAICENPDDDAPRLIYADWLDEHGDPRQAEFIRVQIELAHEATADRADALRNREGELRNELKRGRYLTSNWVNLTSAEFKRGFCTSWKGPIAKFLAVSPNFCRYGPVEVLGLSFEYGRTPPTTEVQSLSECQFFRGLKSLSLTGDQLTDEWAVAFIDSPFAGQWQSLTLSGDDLSDVVCDRLASSLLVQSQCQIIIESNGLTRRGAAVVERVFGSRQRIRKLEVDDDDDEDEDEDDDLDLGDDLLDAHKDHERRVVHYDADYERDIADADDDCD
jgi:uncharacterized protein (TIGR02996 family)